MTAISCKNRLPPPPFSYPPNENALAWQVAAGGSGSARVRISYLLGNLTKSFNYRAVADHDESTLVFSQYIRLQNFANEAFGSTGLWAGFGTRFLKAVGINETKQMLMEKYEKVPVKKTYTADVQAFGYLNRPQNKLTVPMHYVLKNDQANKLGQAPGLRAKNVDLSTVPDRDTVQLTIYNSEDITLVRETRRISFRQGSNPLQFSWANTLIDPTSVQLRYLTQPDQLEVLDTTFPHDKPQMLYWNVQSELDGEATIEIAYFTSGIRWSADYVLVADRD